MRNNQCIFFSILEHQEVIKRAEDNDHSFPTPEVDQSTISSAEHHTEVDSIVDQKSLNDVQQVNLSTLDHGYTESGMLITHNLSQVTAQEYQLTEENIEFTSFSQGDSAFYSETTSSVHSVSSRDWSYGNNSGRTSPASSISGRVSPGTLTACFEDEHIDTYETIVPTRLSIPSYLSRLIDSISENTSLQSLCAEGKRIGVIPSNVNENYGSWTSHHQAIESLLWLAHEGLLTHGSNAIGDYNPILFEKWLLILSEHDVSNGVLRKVRQHYYKKFPYIRMQNYQLALHESHYLVQVIQEHSSLTGFELTNCTIGDPTPFLFSLQLRSTKLRELVLTNSQIGDNGIKVLAEISNCFCSLEILNLRANNITDIGFMPLAANIKHFKSLKHIYLSFNHICDTGAQTLAQNLSVLTSLEELDLRCNNIGDEGAIAVIRAIKDATTLLVWNHRLRQAEVGTIMSLKPNSDEKFQVLNSEIFNSDDEAKALAFNINDEVYSVEIKEVIVSSKCTPGILHAVISVLSNCKNLQTLILERNYYDTCSIKALVENLKHCSSLKVFKFDWNTVDTGNIVPIAEILHNHKVLQSLHLIGNGLTGDCATALAKGLKQNNFLQALNLGGNYVGADGAEAIAKGLQHCKCLQMLNLAGNSIKADGAKALAEGLKYCNCLETLNLGGNGISSNGIEALTQGLQHCSDLKTLELDWNNIGADGANSLSKILKHLSRLQTLNLEGNYIDDGGAVALAEGLSGCSSLQILRLGGNGIGDSGVRALASALKYCNRLQILDLNRNCVSDEGVRVLAEGLCHSLHTLDLGSNNISSNSAKAIANTLQVTVIQGGWMFEEGTHPKSKKLFH